LLFRFFGLGGWFLLMSVFFLFCRQAFDTSHSKQPLTTSQKATNHGPTQPINLRVFDAVRLVQNDDAEAARPEPRRVAREQVVGHDERVEGARQRGVDVLFLLWVCILLF
jgi:hypothetical protein